MENEIWVGSYARDDKWIFVGVGQWRQLPNLFNMLLRNFRRPTLRKFRQFLLRK